MKVLTGHLTETHIRHIKAMLALGVMSGKIKNTNYFITLRDNVYTVDYFVRDRGFIPSYGDKLRTSKYTSNFTI